MHLNVNVVPHPAQRYLTSGDWWYENEGETLTVTVSDLGDARYNMLVAVHEIVEALLCKERGIAEEEVTKFDVTHPELEEPGEEPTAPYYKEHMTASVVEHAMAALLGVDWGEYSRAFDSLPERTDEPGA